MNKGSVKVIIENKATATLVFAGTEGKKIPLVSLNKSEVAQLQRDLTRVWKELE